MKILLTGGAGFIGSNLAARCLREKIELDIVDDLSNGHPEFVTDLIKSDNLLVSKFDSDAILDRVRSKEYDVIVHLAAVPRVSYSVEKPLETHETNVTSTLRLLDAARGNTKRFVFASSSSVYGGSEELPTCTSAKKNPQSPYALQKSIIEDYLKMYHKLYDLDSISLRFFNVFGPNQIGGSPYSTAVSAWLTCIMKNQPMRSDGDGSQTRDMCYVDNVSDACIKSIMTKKELKAEAINVACGDRTSNKEILNYLLNKFPGSKYYDAPWRPGDVMHTQADISMSEELIGYKPLVKFWEGLDKTIDWYQNNQDLIEALSAKENI